MQRQQVQPVFLFFCKSLVFYLAVGLNLSTFLYSFDTSPEIMKGLLFNIIVSCKAKDLIQM